MKRQKLIMGMPSTIEIASENADEKDIEKVFNYFEQIDKKFSPYKKTSEVEQINNGTLLPEKYSSEMKKIITMAEKTQAETAGYFTVTLKDKFDPSGIVKGYAIHEGAKILQRIGYQNFSVEIGGDIEVHGKNSRGEEWQVGIRNPFQPDEIVKILRVTNKGVATSGTYLRGEHIYDPIHKRWANDIASMTVIGPNIYEADRFATAAFAMGNRGIAFIDSLSGFAGYMMSKDKRGYMTKNFSDFVQTQ